MLGYCREIELQGALVLAKRGRMELGDNYGSRIEGKRKIGKRKKGNGKMGNQNAVGKKGNGKLGNFKLA